MTGNSLLDIDQPLVTVYIPVYNHQKFVGKAIESMLEQTYRNIEFIIINDGSTDGSDGIIKNYIYACRNRFVRFSYVNRPNKGLSETINEALTWSLGVYIGGCASDDYWAKEKIETQVGFLDTHRSHIGCGSGYAVVDDENRILSIKKRGRMDYAFKNCLIDALQPRALTMLWRKEVFNIVGRYNKDTKIEDWEYMLRVLKSGQRVATLDAVLAYYRNHSSNTMKQLDLVDSEENKILSQYSNEELFNIARKRAVMRQTKRRLLQGKKVDFNLDWLLWSLQDRRARELISLYVKNWNKNK